MEKNGGTSNSVPSSLGVDSHRKAASKEDFTNLRLSDSYRKAGHAQKKSVRLKQVVSQFVTEVA